MSNLIGQRMAQIDRIADYVPVVSTVTNIINIALKAIMDSVGYTPDKEKHYYLHYLDNMDKQGKSYWRCFAAIVPVFGNLGLGIYEYRQDKSEESDDSRRHSLVVEAPLSSDESSSVRGGISPVLPRFSPPSSPALRASPPVSPRRSYSDSGWSDADESSDDGSDIISPRVTPDLELGRSPEEEFKTFQIGIDKWLAHRTDDCAELKEKIIHCYKNKLENLDLSNYGLTSLPPEIGQLTHLETLDLSWNQLKALPDEFWRLTKLQKLRLNDNCFHSLPSEIGELVYLETLGLKGNHLRSLPPEIGQLSMLHVLILTGNRLKSLPVELWELGRTNPHRIERHIHLSPELLSNSVFSELRRILKTFPGERPLFFDAECQHIYGHKQYN